MKNYIADVLTALRFISAIVLIVLTCCASPPEYALWAFVAGELTDAFDGIAARKWPFDPAHTPRYRRYAELYDMIADVALGLAALTYVTVHIHTLLGATIAAVAVETGIFVELLVWGHLFGSPERCYSDYLWHTDRRLARTIILVRRRLYLVAIVLIVVIMLCSTSYSTILKCICVVTGIVVSIILLIIKKNRLHQVKTK